MAPLATIVAATLSLLSTASAHFVLLNPPSLEGATLDDKKEGNGPCGALLPDLTKTPAYDFHVDGDFLSVQNGHPQSNWLFRATLEDKAAGNWTQIYPLVQQAGIGNYCQVMVSAPKEWVGKKGVIGVVGNAPDGLLYQVCCPLFFIASRLDVVPDMVRAVLPQRPPRDTSSPIPPGLPLGGAMTPHNRG